jgi:hypothetical protein
MVDFRLRPMEPRDVPAMDALLRHEPQRTPKLELVAPVQSPVPLAGDRLLYMWR